MKAFAFNNYSEEIDIAGHVFTIDTSTDTGDKVRVFTLSEKELASEVASGTKPKEELLAKFQHDIDEILGKGAFDKIFEGRTPCVPDASDVMLYIVDFLIDSANRRRDNRASALQSKIQVMK